jgi:hypothetical protein
LKENSFHTKDKLQRAIGKRELMSRRISNEVARRSSLRLEKEEKNNNNYILLRLRESRKQGPSFIFCTSDGKG